MTAICSLPPNLFGTECMMQQLSFIVIFFIIEGECLAFSVEAEVFVILL